MPIFRWGTALDAFRDLEREVDRWVRTMDVAFESPRIGRPFPSLNLYDCGGEYLITAELAGCNGQQLDLSVANGIVTMRGTRDVVSDVDEKRIRRSERPSGTWERSISVPERIDDDAIRAEFTNGLLRLYLPKAPLTKPKQISVKGTGGPDEENEHA